MTGLTGQNKGKRGEREIKDQFIEVMQEVEAALCVSGLYSDEVKRNTLQSDRGGADLVGIPLLSIEIKRQETITINPWWTQTVAQANKNKAMPVLIYRQSRKPWRVVTYSVLCQPGYEARTWVRSEMDLTNFIDWYKDLYRDFLRGSVL